MYNFLYYRKMSNSDFVFGNSTGNDGIDEKSYKFKKFIFFLFANFEIPTAVWKLDRKLGNWWKILQISKI